MKMFRSIFFACLCLSSVPVSAQDVGDGMFALLCQSVPEYHAPEGVAYKAGEDVHGKPVMPADLAELGVEMPDVITVPVTADLVKHFSSQNVALPDGVKLEPDVGMIEIHQDGRVTYNGHDLSKNVYAVCHK